MSEKQYTVVTSGDMDKLGAPPVVEPTPEEKAAADEKIAAETKAADEEKKLDEEAELLTEEEKALPEEEQTRVKKTRISKNKRALMEAEEKLKVLEERAAVAESKLKELTPKPKLTEKPSRGQFNSLDDYETAISAWAEEQATVKAQLAYEKKVRDEQFNARQKEFAALTTDYASALEKSSVRIPIHIEEAILESELAPQILYYLAKNEKEADKLSGKYGLKELGSIERMLKQEKKAEEKKEESREDFKSTPSLKIVENKKPPEPINPVRGNSNNITSTFFDANGKFTGDYQTFKKLSKEGKIK